jgi:hypothetical protein
MTTSTQDGTILKKDRLGRIMYSKERRAALLAEFDQGGMTAKSFANWAGIKYGTFITWLCNREKALAKKDAAARSGPESQAPVQWVEAVDASGPTELTGPRKAACSPSSASQAMVVQGPRGVRLELSEERHVLWAAKLLQHLEGVC